MKKILRKENIKKIALIIVLVVFISVVTPVKSLGAYPSILTRPLTNLIVTVIDAINMVFTLLVKGVVGTIADADFVDAVLSSGASIFVSPEEIFQGGVPITNVNIFDAPSASGVNLNMGPEGLIKSIKSTVQTLYIFLRNISAIVMLAALVYVGIMIILSNNNPQAQSQWKQKIVFWIKGLILVMFIHVIMIALFYFNDKLITVLNFTATSGDSILVTIKKDYNDIHLMDGEGVLIDALLYAFASYTAWVFAIAYLKRFMYMMVMIIIAPIFGALYGTGNFGRQRFKHWMKEFIAGIMVQPFHMLIFYILFYIPLSVMQGNGTVGGVIHFGGNIYVKLYALMSILMIRPIEKFVRGLFGFSGTAMDNVASFESGKKTLDAGIKKAVSVVKTAVGIGATIATGGAAAGLMGGLGGGGGAAGGLGNFASNISGGQGGAGAFKNALTKDGALDSIAEQVAGSGDPPVVDAEGNSEILDTMRLNKDQNGMMQAGNVMINADNLLINGNPAGNEPLPAGAEGKEGAEIEGEDGFKLVGETTGEIKDAVFEDANVEGNDSAKLSEPVEDPYDELDEEEGYSRGYLGLNVPEERGPMSEEELQEQLAMHKEAGASEEELAQLELEFREMGHGDQPQEENQEGTPKELTTGQENQEDTSKALTTGQDNAQNEMELNEIDANNVFLKGDNVLTVGNNVAATHLNGATGNGGEGENKGPNQIDGTRIKQSGPPPKLDESEVMKALGMGGSEQGKSLDGVNGKKEGWASIIGNALTAPETKQNLLDTWGSMKDFSESLYAQGGSGDGSGVRDLIGKQVEKGKSNFSNKFINNQGNINAAIALKGFKDDYNKDGEVIKRKEDKARDFLKEAVPYAERGITNIGTISALMDKSKMTGKSPDEVLRGVLASNIKSALSSSSRKEAKQQANNIQVFTNNKSNITAISSNVQQKMGVQPSQVKNDPNIQKQVQQAVAAELAKGSAYIAQGLAKDAAKLIDLNRLGDEVAKRINSSSPKAQTQTVAQLDKLVQDAVNKGMKEIKLPQRPGSSSATTKEIEKILNNELKIRIGNGGAANSAGKAGKKPTVKMDAPSSSSTTKTTKTTKSTNTKGLNSGKK